MHPLCVGSLGQQKLCLMESSIYKPEGPLSSFVDFFWSQNGYEPISSKERILPTGSIQLIINLDEIAFQIYEETATHVLDPIIVTCAQAEPVIINSHSRRSTLGVQFKPGGIFPLLHIKADELNGEIISLSSIIGNLKSDKLYSRLLGSTSPLKQLKCLEQFLLGSLGLGDSVHPVVMFALQKLQSSFYQDRISELAESFGLSPKRFTDIFKQEVGITPKLFSRIKRFQQVLTRINSKQPINWTHLAFEFGYYDQSHLIRDFKVLSALTPSEYNTIHLIETNHIPL